MMDRRKFLCAGSAAAAFGAPARAGRIDMAGELGASAQFLSLMDALAATGLLPLFRTDGPYTFFAPRESAFLELPPAARRSFATPAGLNQLRAILLHHVVPGRFSILRFQGRRLRVPTMGGGTLVVDGAGNGVKVGRAHVGLAEIAASNGMIHQVNRLILPV